MKNLLMMFLTWLFPTLSIPQTPLLPKIGFSSPVIVAAGDIACGAENKNQPCKQTETAQLIEQIKPQAVLALGDIQYQAGQLQNFLDFYDKSLLRKTIRKSKCLRPRTKTLWTLLLNQ